MYFSNGRFVRMVELSTANDRELFELVTNNRDEYRKFIFDQNIPESYTGFLTQLKSWFVSGRIYQFLVYKKSSNQLIGTIFFYHYNEKNRSIKTSVFLKDNARRSCSAAESMGLAIAFARQILNIRSILFSVYTENKHMLRVVQNLGLKPKIYDNPSKLKHGGREVFDYEIPEQMIEKILLKLRRLET